MGSNRGRASWRSRWPWPPPSTEGAGFGKQHATVLERVGHRGGHLPLARARLEMIDGAGEHAIIGKRGVDRGA